MVVALTLLTVVMRLLPKPPLAQRYSSGVAVYDEKRRLLRLTLSADD